MPVDAAEEMGDFLVSLDEGLGIEVLGEDSQASRHVIVTAFSDPTKFSLVTRLVNALEVPGWSFEGLKPPRGFAFTIALDDVALDAKALKFCFDSASRSLLLTLPPHLMRALPEDSRELAWLLVETGVGERLAAELESVSFAYPSDVPASSPIVELQHRLEFLARH